MHEIETEQEELLEHIKHTYRFFNNVQSRLRNTNKRLDRIQPKIRQLFFTLSQPEYSAKIDRFIRFLLKYSTLEKKGNDKEIVFPKEINTKTTNYKRPKYLLLDRDRNLFPTKAKPRKKYIRNTEVEELSKAILQKAFDDTEIIENWVSLFFAELQKSKALDISQGFFSVLKETNDFTIATKVTFRVIEDAHNNEKFKVNIDKTDFVKNENTALWKTMIFQK